MRGWLLMSAAAALSGCGGLLILEEQHASGTRAARCADSTECDVGLVCAECDAYTCCVESSGPCGPSHPDGDCPIGQTCASGVCVEGGSSWCDCLPGQGCQGGVCVDIEPGNQCSTINPDGLCQEGLVCNGGSCVPCTSSNACRADNPHGCCRDGAVCRAGRCYSEPGEACSPTNTSGTCPAGQVCNAAGQCEEVACSPQHPFGVCSPGNFCDGGACVCIPCSLDNLAGCCPAEQFCSVVAGTCIPDATCEGDLDCLAGELCSVTRVCLTPPACNDPADCRIAGEVCASGQCTTGCTSSADCDTGYTCNGTVCVADTCQSLGCAALNRNCDDTTHGYAICTDCLTGFHEDAGLSCVADTCADIDCAAINRVCDDTTHGYAVCGGCLPGYDEVNGICGNCQVTADCPQYQYCSDTYTCKQDCDPTTMTLCADGDRCSPYGRCVPEGPDADACAAAVNEGEIIEPYVMLVVDRSGSMDWEYDPTRTGESRWGDLTDALFNTTDGVVYTLQDQIRFGLALYTGTSSTCPDMLWEYPALNNHGPMSTLASNHGPASGTPTAESIMGVVTYMNTLPSDRSKYILLATDGEPYRCEDLSSRYGHAYSVWAASQAFANDIRLFMLSVGQDVADSHMQDVANAGAGCGMNSFYDDVATCNLGNSTCRNKQNDVTDYTDYDPWVVRCPDDPSGNPINHPFYKATNKDQLIDDLGTILGSVLSCVVRLNVTPGAPPLDGRVYLDGDPLVRGAPDGWEITGVDTVQFLGASCTAITNGQSHFIAIVIDECDTQG